jgi:hypothetical protein
MAAKNRDGFVVAIATRLIPNVVRVSIEHQLPGNLGAEDWALLLTA